MNKVNIISLFLLTLFFGYASELLLDVKSIFTNSLLENYTQNQIENILDIQSKWRWIGYVFVPLLLLIKISIIAAILDIGCFFFSKEIKYKKLFNIVVKAEFIFLLVIVFKTAWFYFFKTSYTLEDLQFFYPLSAINIIGYEGLQPWFIYPFQVLNLFELAYWFILAYLIGKELNESTDKGMSIVASSYGVSLLIWVVGVMFFTLNMS
ncbi:hypothetical protein [Gaetbulibacter jejuensis]|uniref:hypothetical protein n=1 Tax=Gaetbulibacter jejuensis TaxID=584607 RepID=UPI00300B1855